MKIIQLIYSLASGGAERFAVSLSNQLAEMFVKALEKNIENLRNRDDYRCFAKDLKFLAKNLTAFEKASELREKWLVEYKRKSALCEELRWAF